MTSNISNVFVFRLPKSLPHRGGLQVWIKKLAIIKGFRCYLFVFQKQLKKFFVCNYRSSAIYALSNCLVTRFQSYLEVFK